MPERPDLEYVVPRLDLELRGRRVSGTTLRKPVVLRVTAPGGLASLHERRVERAWRRAHFVVLECEGELDLVVAPMLAGRFAFAPAGSKAPADLALALPLDDGRELRYRDDVQMGKVYLTPRAQRDAVPGFAEVGVDVLDRESFTRERLRSLARKRREQVKVFLMDKRTLDSFGNAYADEVCWVARLHPKRRVGSLTPAETDALHGAIVSVLTEACATIRERAPALDEKVRDFLHARGRAGQPCHRCGAKLRRAGVHGHDSDFCPECQVDEGATSLVDWRKLPRAAGG